MSDGLVALPSGDGLDDFDVDRCAEFFVAVPHGRRYDVLWARVSYVPSYTNINAP